MRPIEITSRGRVLRGMHYEGGGQGTVLLAHGFSSTRTGPGQLLVTFARALVARGMSVLAFDRAGHGESDGAFRDVTVPDEIEQLSAMLDLAPGGAHLAGHSLGAMELASLAGRRPDDVLSLTLWAAAAESKDQAEYGLVMGKRIEDGPDGAYVDIGGQALGPAFLGGLRSYDPYAGLEHYTGPVHLHHGCDDRVVNPTCASRYQRIWPQSDLRMYPGTGHDWADFGQRRALIAESVEQITAVEWGWR